MAVHPSLTVADWHRLNRLLEQGLEFEGAARIAWLDALGREDQHLRAVLVDLLQQSDSTDFDDAASPPASVANMAAQALAAMRREQAGDRIGPWQLERLLAEGGMGSVWVAQRADGVMKRTAALKLPRAEWIDHGLTERIARERGILARLQHPHIAVLYDAGITDNGRPYLALEYVDGAPIDAWCRGRDLRAILQLFVHVIRAVAYAHAQLVIHRDLKPANVLVTADGLPKLLDFGISKLIEGETPTVEATALTRLAGRPLTLAYAAPEQVLGMPITVAADVYALGVMLFELVAQARLYRATEPRTLEAEILRGDPRKPSDATDDKARAKVLRGDLDAIIGTALKRGPEERYQSAAALADDIDNYLAGLPVKAQPDSRTYRLRKFITRNRLPVMAGSAVVVALGIGLGVALWQANEARDQAQRATAMNTFVLSLIQQADPNASAQTKAADVAMLSAIASRIDSEFKGSPDQLLQLRVTVGDAYKNRGETAAAQQMYQRAVDEAAPVLPADHLQLLTARVRAADYNLIVSSAVSESLDGAIAVLRTKGAAGAELLIDALLTRHELDTFFGGLKMLPPGQRFATLDEALETANRHFGEGSRQHLKVARPYAELTDMLRDGLEARRVLAQALDHARRRTDGVTSSFEYRDATSLFAAHLCHSERVAEGLSLLRESLATARAAYGESSVQVERLLLAQADCESGGGSADMLLWEEVFKVAAARERPPSTNLMRRAEEAFGFALNARNYEAAERYYQSAIDNSRAVADPALRERLMLNIRIERVCLLANRGDADEAEAFAAPIAKLASEEFARHGRITFAQAPLQTCLSFAQRQNGRFDEAARTAQAFVMRCRASKLPYKQPCEGRGLIAQALAELDAGRNAEALATIEERLKFDDEGCGTQQNLCLAYGRALLANGRPTEALEPLRLAYGVYLESADSTSFAAEAEYWFGQAWIANGDIKRGRWMVAEAKKILATSKLRSHQTLANGTVS